MIDAAKHIPVELFKISDAAIRFELQGPFTVELMKDSNCLAHPSSIVIDKVWCSLYADDMFIGVSHDGPSDVHLDRLFVAYVKMLTCLDLVPAECESQVAGKTEFECCNEHEEAIKILSRRFLEYESFVKRE
jgi:hypothetical protein